MKKFVITKYEDGIRFNKYIKKKFDSMPDSLMYKLFRKKYFELNGKKAIGDEKLLEGDIISIFISTETYERYATKESVSEKNIDTNSRFDISKIKENIVYEDDNVIVFNKPCGMLSQGDKTNDESVNTILNDYLNNKTFDNFYKPSVINRLDRNTQGLIIFAKNYIASREISQMIKEGRLGKYYKTTVNGVIEDNNNRLINLYKKDEKNNKAIIRKYCGKKIDGYCVVELEYSVLKREKDITTLDIKLMTGKSHQIRAQLAYINHPILCDKKYMNLDLYIENRKKYKNKFQFLKCYKIVFDKFENATLDSLSGKTISIENKK